MFGPRGDEMGPPMSVYCGSIPAIEAAAAVYPGNDADLLTDALVAIHDAALGLDRSVCLRDVVAFLDALSKGDWSDGGGKQAAWAAEVIEREFGGQPRRPLCNGRATGRGSTADQQGPRPQA